MSMNKWVGILLTLIISASAVSLFTDSADANAGDTEDNPLIWFNQTIILLPEVVAGEITDPDTQVNVPPTSLAIDWGDGTIEVKEVDGYVTKGSLEIVHTYAATGTYHITCTPQNTSGETGYKYTTYELWMSIWDAPTVSFYDGDEKILPDVTAYNGINVGAYEDNYFSKISKPADPEKEGYVFDCWTCDGEEFDFSTAITAPTVLQAKWTSLTPVNITVDGTSTSMYEGDTIGDLTVPTKDGFFFTGWYSDENCTYANKYDNSTVLTDGMTIYAGWTDTVVIVVDGKETTLDAGSTVADLTVPTKDGYAFNGWYADEDLTVPVSGTTVLTAGMKLYASYNENETGSEKDGVSTLAIILCIVGAIIAFVGLRYHPIILVIGIAVAVLGVADIYGLIEVIR